MHSAFYPHIDFRRPGLARLRCDIYTRGHGNPLDLGLWAIEKLVISMLPIGWSRIRIEAMSAMATREDMGERGVFLVHPCCSANDVVYILRRPFSGNINQRFAGALAIPTPSSLNIFEEGYDASAVDVEFVFHYFNNEKPAKKL